MTTKRVSSGGLLRGRSSSPVSYLSVSFDNNNSSNSDSAPASRPTNDNANVGAGADAPTVVDDASDNDGDPLMSLFRVHNTNRVQFDLTPIADEDEEHEDEDELDEDGYDNDNTISISEEQFNDNDESLTKRKGASEKFKKLVRSASFTKKKQPTNSNNNSISNNTSTSTSSRTPSNLTASCLLSKEISSFDIEDPEEAFIKKMLEPTPMKKIGSFLNNMKANTSSTSSGSGSSEDYMKSIRFDDPSPSTTNNKQQRSSSTTTNSSNNTTILSKSTKNQVAKLLKKAHKAHKKTFRYRLAMKYYLLALKEMTTSGYTDTDPLMAKVVKSLNDVHHAQSTVSNSANIVQMGIQHEDKNQLIKALRMYTISYRMRRDVLGVDHPSLAVLLNMMGSVQVKRGEYSEAMKIYELSLKGRPDENGGLGRMKDVWRGMNPLTTSVTLRDMGMILEHNGNEDKALKFYHASLRYAIKYKDACDQKAGRSSPPPLDSTSTGEKDWLMDDNMDNTLLDEPFSLDEVRMAKSTTMGKSSNCDDHSDAASENGEMELFLEKRFDRLSHDNATAAAAKHHTSGKSESTKFYYDELFLSSSPDGNDQQQQQQQQQQSQRQPQGEEGAEIDIAMSLHQIGQIHRRSNRYAAALSAYNASLRGMKEVLGSQHGNIAAILGNVGNLYMETGDYDEAFTIYQEVLGIETIHLGLSHPEVAITLHNIATIECSRGNFSEGVSLYKQVVDMQKIRYGSEHLTVAITLSCLADAYEKLRNVNGAIKTYEEALKIRIAVLGKSHLDVARLMHKLGRLASSRKDYGIAEIYVLRAAEIYNENGLEPDHVFMREMARDRADIQAGLAFGSR